MRLITFHYVDASYRILCFKRCKREQNEVSHLDTEYFLFLFTLIFVAALGLKKIHILIQPENSAKELVCFSSVETLRKVKYLRTMNDNIHLLRYVSGHLEVI